MRQLHPAGNGGAADRIPKCSGQGIPPSQRPSRPVKLDETAFSKPYKAIGIDLGKAILTPGLHRHL